MNSIAEQSSDIYNSLRYEALKKIKPAVELQIRDEVTQDYANRLENASIAEKRAINMQIEKEIKQRVKERCEPLLVEQGLPKASSESLW